MAIEVFAVSPPPGRAPAPGGFSLGGRGVSLGAAADQPTKIGNRNPVFSANLHEANAASGGESPQRGGRKANNPSRVAQAGDVPSFVEKRVRRAGD